jgi:predicted amidohydrolase YtcJ
MEEVIKIAGLASENGLQLCVHAIGDKANREVLNIFENQFSKVENGNKLRWRIEHAQHLDVTDIPRFSELGVIPSMQAIHCTSDAPFVEKRLGLDRAKYGAYPWRSLIDAGAVVTNGTDAPVEDVDPIPSFYASVTRKRYDDTSAFFPEQAMTREEAIYSYTLANAYAAFEEDWKGSLEPGKVADLVVLSKNLLTCSEEEIKEVQVKMTFVNGKLKYSAPTNE